MDYPARVKIQARALRQEGLTYREICQKLKVKVPKATLSGWLKNIKLSKNYYSHIKLLSSGNLKKANIINKLRLEQRLASLRTKNIGLVKYIDKNIGKLILATLYWCEGGKYPGRSFIQFGSSDLRMIRLFLLLLRSCFCLDENKFRLTVQCRADQDGISLRKYWLDITNIPWDQHYQPRIDKRSVGKPTLKKDYHGVCVIDYFDSNLQCELQFLGEYLGTVSAISQMLNQIK